MAIFVGCKFCDRIGSKLGWKIRVARKEEIVVRVGLAVVTGNEPKCDYENEKRVLYQVNLQAT